MIITIDGTSASGKTSVARELAHRLGFALLRTGAMYRAFALAAHRMGQDDPAQPAAVLDQLSHWQIDADEDKVYLNGMDVSGEIDGDLMSRLSSSWAELPDVRKHINTFIHQRAASYLAEGRSFVTEGRDQGSFVFPEAECKFFIQAASDIRAQRRLHDLHRRNDTSKSLHVIEKELIERDTRDAERPVAPLVVPAGAMIIDNSHLTKAEVVDQLYCLVQQRRGLSA